MSYEVIRDSKSKGVPIDLSLECVLTAVKDRLAVDFVGRFQHGCGFNLCTGDDLRLQQELKGGDGRPDFIRESRKLW